MFTEIEILNADKIIFHQYVIEFVCANNYDDTIHLFFLNRVNGIKLIVKHRKVIIGFSTLNLVS